MNTENSLQELYEYKSQEYENRIKESDISIEDAKKILCDFVKNKKRQGYYLYFIYKNSYVFKDTGFGKSLSGITVRGLNGIYIDIFTGNIKEITTVDSEKPIFLKNNNYLYLQCSQSQGEFITPLL